MMGHGIYSQCTNNFGGAFNGNDAGDNCMYDMGNLASLPSGSSSFYVETKNSGGCFFESSWFYEGFALPGVPSGRYNFMIGFGSPSASPLNPGSGWAAQTASDGQNNTAYVWIIPGGIPVHLVSFQPCGDQSCLVWTVGSGGDKDSSGKPTSAPFQADPKDGSDYQGDPKKAGKARAKKRA
jgi:hypothetical protein